MSTGTTPTTSTSTAAPAPGIAAVLSSVGGAVQRSITSGALWRWTRRLLLLALALVVLGVLFVVAVGLITTHWWFASTGHGAVYTTMLEAKILLFCVFGALAGLFGGLTMMALRRIRPALYFSPDDDTFRWTFRRYEARFGRYLVMLAVIVPAVLVGRSAASSWQTYLLWRHATTWHATDPVLHNDIGFYVFVYPFHQLVVTLLMQAVGYCLWIAAVGGYWYGAWRLRGGRKKVTRGMTTLLCVLLAGYLVLRAANAWLSRYALLTSPTGPVTGAGYTDVHAGLPSRYVLMAVALVSAAILIANAVVPGRLRVFDARVRTLVGALVFMVIGTLVAGTAWPGLVYRYREAPSAASLDLSEIRHNQTATRAAFGLRSNVTTQSYSPTTAGADDPDDIAGQATTDAQIPILDSNQLSPTFNVEQQLQAYYGFKSTLDTSHYDINGRSRDVVLAVRELFSNGIPKKGWVNNHLVYTHGYGVVAAPTTEVEPTSQSPVYLNGGIPPGQQIPVSRPQIYFGQSFTGSSYAIVGRPASSTKNLEFDHPGAGGTKSVTTTYTGDGGIKIGSLWRRLLFAVQLKDTNILFSSELNSASQLLEIRDPRTRVAKVAPWLTLDGDTYPAVVDGHVEWVVDGYTTSSNYPESQLVNLRSATRTTLTTNGASFGQSSTTVNYLQNSVKAVVDAYTGKVRLYEWNQQQQPDPVLKTWESAFPGLVKAQTQIPAALLPQLRYPTDLFNVQRSLLAKYHVTQPGQFYNGNDFWTVPADPTVASANTINSRSGGPANVPIASKYISMSIDGSGAQRFTLSSPLVTLNGRQLAAYVSVDAEPGPSYGRFTVLTLPSATGGESPAQVQNDIESDTSITEALTLQRGGNSSVVLGSLVAVPVAGRMLYVEPVYTQSSGGSSFPILRHVIALYGNGNPSFENTLGAAVQAAIASGSGGSG